MKVNVKGLLVKIYSRYLIFINIQSRIIESRLTRNGYMLRIPNPSDVQPLSWISEYRESSQYNATLYEGEYHKTTGLRDYVGPA